MMGWSKKQKCSYSKLCHPKKNMRSPSVTLILLFLQINWFFFFTAFSMTKYTFKIYISYLCHHSKPKEISINFWKLLGFTFLPYHSWNRFGFNIIFFWNTALNSSQVIVKLCSFELLFPCLNLVLSQHNINKLRRKAKITPLVLTSEVRNWSTKSPILEKTRSPLSIFIVQLKLGSKTKVLQYITPIFLWSKQVSKLSM